MIKKEEEEEKGYQPRISQTPWDDITRNKKK